MLVDVVHPVLYCALCRWAEEENQRELCPPALQGDWRSSAQRNRLDRAAAGLQVRGFMTHWHHAHFTITHWHHAHFTITHWHHSHSTVTHWHHVHYTTLHTDVMHTPQLHTDSDIMHTPQLHTDIIHTPQLLTPWALYNFTHWHHAHSTITHWYHAHSTELYTLTPCTLYSCTLMSCALYSYTLTSCTLHWHVCVPLWHMTHWHTESREKRWFLRAIDIKDYMDVHIYTVYICTQKWLKPILVRWGGNPLW